MNSLMKYLDRYGSDLYSGQMQSEKTQKAARTGVKPGHLLPGEMSAWVKTGCRYSVDKL